MRILFINGEKIYLRGLSKNDLDGGYLGWLNDADVCQYNSHHIFPYYRENGEEYIRKTLRSRSNLVLAINLKENDLHIGNVSLQKIDYINRSAEFAILIGEKNCWRKGYSKEAAMLILTHGFKELNLQRIYCGTSVDNIGMQRLAASLGMSKEGRRRNAIFKHGVYKDILEFGILRDEFDKRLKE